MASSTTTSDGFVDNNTGLPSTSDVITSSDNRTELTPGGTEVTTTTAEGETNSAFIIAMACFGAGVLLVVIAFIFIVLWCQKTSDVRKMRKRRHRTKEHTRYLKDYSVKTGGAPDEFTPTGSQRSSQGIFTLGGKFHKRAKDVGGGDSSANGSAVGSIKGSDIVLVESEQTQGGEAGANGDVADVRF